MKKINLVAIILTLALALGLVSSSSAEDAEIKLNSNNGSTKLVVKNSNAVTVFSADSAGNMVVGGTMPVAGTRFSVGGSTFVVKDGYIGIGTTNPGAALEVAGQVKITGGSPGAGKVLGSDASGLAAWQVAASTFSIGSSYGGGKIFWLDASGKHGLIAATADQSTGIQWGPAGFTGANLAGIYAGKANTVIISTMQGAGSYAAQVCSDYSVTVNNEYYDDWYLPSIYELQLLYAQNAAVGNFIGYFYWSSNEYVPDTAVASGVTFTSGSMTSYFKTATYYVRCVRRGP